MLTFPVALVYVLCFHRYAMRGAERSLVRVLLSLTPLRMASRMFPSAPSPASSPPISHCGCCWVSWLASGMVGGLVEAWPLQETIGRMPASSLPANVGESGLSPTPTFPALLFPFTALDMSGTVGIFTGMAGVRIGMGPVPPTEAERRAEGFEEGVRRIVATPGVTITGPWPIE